MDRAFLQLIISLSLGGCGQQVAVPRDKPRDPLVEQALGDPLMTDPDLSAHNEAAAALTVPVDASLPVLPLTPETVGEARAEASEMVAGKDSLVPPSAPGREIVSLRGSNPAAHLSNLPGGSACAANLSVSAAWAARMPVAFAVYPRGATLTAAGRDAPGCKARVMRYRAPVPAEEVLAWYWTRAGSAGLAPVYRLSGNEHVLTGGRARMAFDIRIAGAGPEAVVRIAALQR